MRHFYSRLLYLVVVAALLLTGCRPVTRLPEPTAPPPTLTPQQVYEDPAGQFTLTLPTDFDVAEDAFKLQGLLGFPTTGFRNPSTGTEMCIILLPGTTLEAEVMMIMTLLTTLAPNDAWEPALFGMLTNNMPAGGEVAATRRMQGSAIRLDGFEPATGIALSAAIDKRGDNYVLIAVKSAADQTDAAATAAVFDEVLAGLEMPE